MTRHKGLTATLATGPMLGLALLLPACGEKKAQAPEAQVQAGIDRSVADVRAAEAAAAAPADPSLTAAEFAARLAQPAAEKGAGKAPAKAAAKAAPALAPAPAPADAG
jgi:hypothetical protein